MPEPISLNQANLDSVLNGDKPALILFTTGEGLRGDFKVAFDKAAKEGKDKIVYARADPHELPELAARFDIGEKPVLIAWYCGETLARRQKPWGTDLPLAVELLQKAAAPATPTAPAEPGEAKASTQANAPASKAPASKAPAGKAPAGKTSSNAGAAGVTGSDELTEQTQEKANPVNQPTVLNAPVEVTDATFEDEVLNSDIPVMVDFWAAWCGPCRMVGPILEKLAGEFAGQIKIAKVDVDANPGLSQAFRIQSIPNLMIVKQRTMIFNQPGALPEAALRDLIQQAIALEIPPHEEEAEESEPEQQ